MVSFSCIFVGLRTSADVITDGQLLNNGYFMALNTGRCVNKDVTMVFQINSNLSYLENLSTLIFVLRNTAKWVRITH